MKYFWDYYYKNKKNFSRPSNFARYCFNNFLKSEKKILDIGCGDGRDSFFFEKKKLIVFAIDKCEIIINKNLARIKNHRIKFYKKDINEEDFSDLGKFDYIYARFFLHAINYKSEKKIFKQFSKIGIKNKTLIFLEFRTINDPLMKSGKKISLNENFTDHYRRFINTKELIKRLKHSKKFKIMKFIEKKGLAKFKKENPVICRLILKLI